MVDLAITAPRTSGEHRAAKAAARLEDGLVRFLLLLGFAALIRAPAWGEWNFGVDDQFYALVGERLLHGDLLYVDVWDRKGPLLYLTFAAIALVSPTMQAYQAAATLSAALGAWGVERIARRIATPAAAMLAALAYLALLSRFEGDNLEAGVFFNSLVIAAAASFVSRMPLLRQGRIDAGLVAGFFCAGLAIAYKQTAAFEGALLGIAAVTMLWRAGTPFPALAGKAAMLAAAGAAPMLATGAFYWAGGHFAELWNAMVTSNFARGYADPGIRAARIFTMAGMLAIPVLFAALGAAARWRESEAEADRAILRFVLLFVLLWALTALAVIFAFPNIYVHYAQSALPPLAILCAGYFSHRKPVWPGLLAVIGLSLALAGTFHLADRWRARPAAQALVDHVRAETPHQRLLVWGAPSYLYSLVDADPPSPLAFPPHLYEGREWTGLDEVAQVRRTLAARPETVVAQTPLPSSPLNGKTVALVDAYTRHCARKQVFTIYDHNGPQVHTVFSRCSGNASR